MRLANLSIRQKLIFISMLTTLCALFLAGLALLSSEYVSSQQSLLSHLKVQSKILAKNCTAALGFDHAKDAIKLLTGLEGAPNITYAIIYSSDGNVFARYQRSYEIADFVPAPHKKQGYEFKKNSLDVFEPIILDGEEIGTLYLQSDLKDMNASLLQYMFVMLCVLTFSLLIAYLLLRKLQRSITHPILCLTGLMKSISQNNNFALRATIHNKDEIGELAQWFNEMLAHIQKRDDELGKYQKDLESLVAARTAELEQANKLLQEELKIRQLAEQSLITTATQLEKSNQELQEFAYIASHDLQEPLRKVQSFGDRLKQKYGDVLTGQGKEYLERMQNAAGRMQVLIQSLLEYSRVTNKPKEFEPVDINAVIKDVLSDLEIRMEQVHGQVHTTTLPTINGDVVQLRQLFQNLIGNALKFHRADKPPVVNIESKRLDGHYEIQITDNGIGFEQKHAERIFTIFQRLHGRTEYEGTGIGLSVCRKIVERHGGVITAYSVPNDGATFKITFPVTG